MTAGKPWLQHGWIEHSQNILHSYQQLLGQPLIDARGSASERAESLFNAPFVVVSHGTQADPLLNYANAVALQLWKIGIPTLLQTPSRMTAEAMHRDERANLLARTTRGADVLVLQRERRLPAVSPIGSYCVLAVRLSRF